MIRQEACLANCRAQHLETACEMGELQLTHTDGRSGAAGMTEREAETQIDG